MTPEQYNQCVDQHADGIFRFALKNLRDDELAKDIVQETFTRMWSRLDTVDGAKGKSYLFTTAHHLICDNAKKRLRNVRMEESHEQKSFTSQDNPDLKDILEQALATLPELQRSVILLRDLEGYSYDEIAELTELTLSQVKVYIYRGRTALKAYIGNLNVVV
jgi:RNA polymerase sigma-70 factor (ECF subfamily)